MLKRDSIKLKMKCLLEQIIIDVLEIVIIKSDSYKLYETLKLVLIKLQEPKRVERINDKMTKFVIDSYRLNGKYHREYDKPCYITNKGYTEFQKNSSYYKRINYGPTRVNKTERWFDCFNVSRIIDNEENPIFITSSHYVWEYIIYFSKRHVHPNSVNRIGERTFKDVHSMVLKSVFDYI